MKSLKNVTYPFSRTSVFGKVKIYRNTIKRIDRYIVSYVTEAGRRKEAYTDQYRAHVRLEEIIEDRKKGALYRNEITGSKALHYAHLEEIMAEHNATLQDAVTAYIARQKKEGFAKIMAADAVEKYLDTIEDKEGRYYGGAKHVLELFGKAFGKTLDKITTPELISYIKGDPSLKIPGVSKTGNGKTRNNHRTHIKTLFKWARDVGGYLPKRENLATDVIKKFKEVKDPIEIFTPAEMEAMLNACPDNLLPYLLLGAYCGIRNAEICRLEWRDLKIDQKLVVLEERVTKVKRRRIAHMTDNMVKWLEKYEGPRDGKIVKVKQVNLQTKALADKLGIAWKKNGLRHSYISYKMALPNCNASELAEWCGNSVNVQQRDYKAIAMPSDAERWFSIAPKG